jgi:hypothetical protein
MLDHDNVPAHLTLSLGKFLTKQNIPLFPTHLAPSNFLLFPKLKNYRKVKTTAESARECWKYNGRNECHHKGTVPDMLQQVEGPLESKFNYQGTTLKG